MKTASFALAFSAAALVAGLATAQQPQGQAKGPQFAWPDRMQNARILPPETGGDRLRDVMRGFALSLGVRCTYCHVGPEGAPLTQLDFVSDANPHKNIARAMMRMTARLNQEALPAISGLSEPRVTCYTCHRGSTEPATDPPPPQNGPAPAAPQGHSHSHGSGERGAP